MGRGWGWWFYDQVRNKGHWDYKQQGKEYENFGNFNFGATGRVGFNLKTLLKGAGWASLKADSAREKALGKPGFPFGIGSGTGSYGDAPEDAEMIKFGVRYYEERYGR